MSKIEEMAKIWIAARLLNGKDGELNIKEFRELSMDAYISGVNAVLKEIEKYANMQDGCYALECIQMIINELRGE